MQQVTCMCVVYSTSHGLVTVVQMVDTRVVWSQPICPLRSRLSLSSCTWHLHFIFTQCTIILCYIYTKRKLTNQNGYNHAETWHLWSMIQASDSSTQGLDSTFNNGFHHILLIIALCRFIHAHNENVAAGIFLWAIHICRHPKPV